MSATRITTESLPSRFGKSLSGVLGGIALFIVALVLLFWNEGRAVKTAKGLAEGESSVVHLESIDPVDEATRNALVHLTGQATSGETLRDDFFAIEVPALKLRRTVEMLQWRENSESKTRTKLGGGTETVTTFTYEKVWSDTLIDSSQFDNKTDYVNPRSMPLESREAAVSEVRLGAYRLGPGLVSQLNRFEEIAPPPTLPEGHVAQGGAIYRSTNSAAPKIGDLRITFKAAMPGEISVVARNANGLLDGYRTKTDTTIEMLEYGIKDHAAMFQAAKQANKMLTFGLRILGIILLFIGVKSVLGPISVVLDVLPFLGSLSRMGTTLIALVVSLPVAIVTIAIAWLSYRPLIGISLIVAAVAVGVFLIIIARKRSAAKTA
jgi:hypothetical protein